MYHLLLQNPFYGCRADIPASGHYTHKGHQIRKAITGFIRKDPWSRNSFHLSIQEVQFDEACGRMCLCNVFQGIFYSTTIGRLEIANISSDSVSKSCDPYLVVIDKDHNSGVGGHFFYSVKVSNRIDSDQGAVSSLAGTLSSGPNTLTTACELTQPLFPPPSHEVVFFVIFGKVRARTLALLLRESGFLVVNDVVREGVDCLSEATFLGSLEGASVSYDSLWTSIGIELGGSREVRSCRRHFGRIIGGQGLLVFVARIQGSAVVV